MERREFYPKKWKLAGSLCFCLALLAIGLFEIQNNSGLEQAGGWLCVVLFGPVGALLFKELLSSGPRLILSGAGLFDRSMGTPVIPWQSILELDTTQVKKGYITVTLADQDQRVANLSIRRRVLASWQRMLGGSVFNVGLSPLDVPSNDIVDTIVKFKNHYAPKRWASPTQ